MRALEPASTEVVRRTSRLHRGRDRRGRRSISGAFLELADNAQRDIAHGVDRTDHLLLADNHIVEQTFKLRRHPRIDQGWVGLFENPEQRQAGLGRHDVLSLGNPENPAS